jgi:molybdopterin synthase sulfur carrier subunit
MATAPERGGSACMVKVRLFAGLRERAGWGERLVGVADGPATPLLLWRQLRLAEAWSDTSEQIAAPAGEPLHPPVARGHQANESGAGVAAGDSLPVGVRVAVNQAFAAADTLLADGDELAFLPPISGG